MEHVVERGENFSKIAAEYNISLNRLLAANPRFKSDPNSVAVGDSLQIPDQATELLPIASAAEAAGAVDELFTVPEGQLTFDAEGQEKRNRYFSRVPHVPGEWSGVTIGRGYDMAARSKDEILQDFAQAAIDARVAAQLADCRGLRGTRARRFLEDSDLGGIEITPAQQKALFIQTYQELAGDVLRICGKQDVVATYGTTDWEELNPLLRDIVIDLRYRGDYTGTTRERVQPALVANDVIAMRSLMADEAYWVARHNVPKRRFKARCDYLAP